ncbi:hypothetical protein C8Q77DRAFT_147461 [Trametes polyzona]|nr:hypothetical protein C8Q77DRAFT_147461 [Trametes polyzona]
MVSLFILANIHDGQTCVIGVNLWLALRELEPVVRHELASVICVRIGCTLSGASAKREMSSAPGPCLADCKRLWPVLVQRRCTVQVEGAILAVLGAGHVTQLVGMIPDIAGPACDTPSDLGAGLMSVRLRQSRESAWLCRFPPMSAHSHTCHDLSSTSPQAHRAYTPVFYIRASLYPVLISTTQLFNLSAPDVQFPFPGGVNASPAPTVSRFSAIIAPEPRHLAPCPRSSSFHQGPVICPSDIAIVRA